MALKPELRRELLALTPEQRQELAEELYESLVGGTRDPEWETAWSPEIEQRMKDVVEDRVELIDAEDVRRELQSEFRNNPRR